MADTWYYLDANGQQVGPVDAATVRAALSRGDIATTNMAWRDGLAAWQPISDLAGELGLLAGAPTQVYPPPRPEPTFATAAAPVDVDPNPYRAPDTVSAEVSFAGGGDVVHAGFWRRWAALFLDQLILAIPLFVVFFVLALALGLSGAAASSQPDPFAVIGLQLLFYVLWLGAALLYYAGLESSEAQATFGKRALGIKVTDAQGQRLSFKHAAGRWFAATLSYMSFYIGFLMAGLTEKKQALHDYIAGTYVVDKWAYTRFPERQERGFSGCLIVFMVVVLGSFLVIPILFVVAVAQFEEYSRRARGAMLEPQGTMVCVVPASSEYLARCRPDYRDA